LPAAIEAYQAAPRITKALAIADETGMLAQVRPAAAGEA
jgi:hypothetical protein